MDSKTIVICDREEGYASAFAHYIMKKEELIFQVQTCSDLSHVLAVQEKEEIDYLFISGEFSREERKKVKAEKIFVLIGNEKSEPEEGEIAVYKYQSGEKLLSELLRECSHQTQENTTFLKVTQKKEQRIIGVYSPVHRIGKTSYALKMGQKMALEKNVLYLNMETYGGHGGHFPEGGQTLSDVLYYAGQEKSNLGLVLATIVRHRGKLDYVTPIQVSEDIKAVSGEEWLELIRKIMEESIYEVLILDMDEGIRDIYEVLRGCDEIHLLVADDKVSESKVRQFEEELLFLGHEDIRRRIIRKERSL